MLLLFIYNKSFMLRVELTSKFSCRLLIEIFDSTNCNTLDCLVLLLAIFNLFQEDTIQV
jgi:hypothetical protein